MVYADRRGLFLNGKAEAASGAPTCEKRVNTFSFCGTGGSFFIKKIAKNCRYRLAKSFFICYNSLAILVMASWSSG